MIYIATKTLRAFEDGVAADQGNAFRLWLGRVMPHMADAYRQDDEQFRSHMGASVIGRECARELWYGFHWSTARKASGRMLRLWNRGHQEEGRFVALLLMIGCNVLQQDENGKQFRISSAGGHYSGSGDGMADGIPDTPGARALTEFKTHNDKSFKKLAGSNWSDYFDVHVMGLPWPKSKPLPTFEGEGVRGAKFEHYVQMQQYMRKMGLAVGIYFAIDKDNDHIYAEIVPLDPELADKFEHRAITIIPMHEPPKRISEMSSWFGCKFCDHRAVCHFGAPPERNCRTCEWIVPMQDGTWQCTVPSQPDGGGAGVTLTKAQQLVGCGEWAKNSKAFK